MGIRYAYSPRITVTHLDGTRCADGHCQLIHRITAHR